MNKIIIISALIVCSACTNNNRNTIPAYTEDYQYLTQNETHYSSQNNPQELFTHSKSNVYNYDYYLDY